CMEIRAQVSTERSALSNIHKQKWDKVESQLIKVIKKDSVNAVARYVFSLYFLDAQNPRHQTDSAYRYATRALTDFTAAQIKQRERMKRFPLDSAILIRLREKIDSTAFEEAKHLNTEQAYVHFIEGFPSAGQRTQAVELRDGAAYLEALKENTYQAFHEFIHKYPQASQVDEAKKRYEKLLFENKTSDKRLSSYESFLKEHPQTTYRREVEKNIFEIATASGDEVCLEAFIASYPESYYAKRARQILFHIVLEKELPLPAMLEEDSLKKIQADVHTYLVPILKDGKFGFINSRGNEVIMPMAETLDKDYLCGNITEDVLVFPDKVVSKNGTIIFKGKVTELNDLGYGFLKIETEDRLVVVHKSGFSIEQPGVTDVKLLSGKFLAFKKDKWSLFTLAGRMLFPYEWDDVGAIENVICLKSNGKAKLATYQQVGLCADHQKLKSNDLFDEVKPWSDKMLWARSGDYAGILDQNLTIVISFEKQVLSPSFFGIVATSSLGKKIYDNKGKEVDVFSGIQISKPWVAVKQAKAWRLFNPEQKKYQSSAFDSISFIGPFAVGHLVDTLEVYFKPDKYIEVVKSRLEFIPGKDSISFVVTDDGEKKTIFNSNGRRLFSGQYDKILYAGHGIFVVIKKEKKGLVSSDGKPVLPLEFDAIGSVSDGVISLLKSMKFGLYHVTQHKQIKPQYDKNINRYNNNYSIAFANGLYGFVDWDGKLKDKFEFEEIRYWNDTAAWVKKNFQWMLYDFIGKKILLDRVKDFKLVSDTKDEKIAIVHQENKYGVISSKTGTIIPATFSDIKNLGTAEEPLYFTEKQVEEASLFVVIYYDKQANLMQRFVYEEDDYERLYCPDN
ncbi:MAG TPA: WG repeat-containing protein, partial [Cyclobacteriaceae bacterium]|nr:WG repeat-containing protein [Cyclobacteriaceae bacterium]